MWYFIKHLLFLFLPPHGTFSRSGRKRENFLCFQHGRFLHKNRKQACFSETCGFAGRNFNVSLQKQIGPNGGLSFLGIIIILISVIIHGANIPVIISGRRPNKAITSFPSFKTFRFQISFLLLHFSSSLFFQARARLIVSPACNAICLYCLFKIQPAFSATMAIYASIFKQIIASD